MPKETKMRRGILKALLAGLILLPISPVLAQENNAPVRLLVGFSAGGALDSVARALAEELRVALNQPVVVENKPGATQRVALGDIKRSKPDGLTLILSNNSPFTVFPHIYKDLMYSSVARMDGAMDWLSASKCHGIDKVQLQCWMSRCSNELVS